MSDEEWAFFEPFVIEKGPKSGRPPTDHRRVLDAVFWIARTGAPWRDLPGELGRWDSVCEIADLLNTLEFLSQGPVVH